MLADQDVVVVAAVEGRTLQAEGDGRDGGGVSHVRKGTRRAVGGGGARRGGRRRTGDAETAAALHTVASARVGLAPRTARGRPGNVAAGTAAAVTAPTGVDLFDDDHRVGGGRGIIVRPRVPGEGRLDGSLAVDGDALGTEELVVVSSAAIGVAAWHRGAGGGGEGVGAGSVIGGAGGGGCSATVGDGVGVGRAPASGIAPATAAAGVALCADRRGKGKEAQETKCS